MRKFQFSYDGEHDDLFLFRKNSKSEGGVELGPVLLDFNSKEGLVGIELMHVSEFLASSLRIPKKAVKEMLDNLVECRVELNLWRNHITTIQVLFLAKDKREVLWSMSVPQVQKPVISEILTT